MSQRETAICTALGLLTALATPAIAENKLEVGGFVGAHIFNDDNELGVDDQEDTISPANSLALGIHVGYALNPLFSVEGELVVMPTDTREVDATPVTVIGWRAHALVHFKSGRLRPFAAIGAGFLTSSPRDQGAIRTDTDFVMHAGVGVKYEVQDNWGVRADARLLLPPSTASEFLTTDWEFLFGLYKTFPAKKKPAGGDRDGDGIGDDSDKCPDDAEDPDGFEDDDGCPDKDDDNDGIPDTADACPNQAEDMNGIEDTDGCPENDPDGDGIIGAADRCPDAAEDKDGFEDEDGCPDPDNDADGVGDAEDKCPTEKETHNNYQDDDGCPDTVPTAVQKFTGTIVGIKFEINSSAIKPSSFPILDEAAGVLTKYPSVRLEVEGHTDSIGERAHNVRLSDARAAAVVKYLIGKGVDAARLSSKGYGPDKPVGDNKTSAGRAQNRRVDFVLTSN